MIGILADDYNLELVEGALIKGSKYVTSLGEYLTVSILTLHERDEPIEVWFLELFAEYGLPICRYTNICHRVNICEFIAKIRYFS